jgi:uncharacterized protein YhhL (DUF1145 family)
MIDIIAIGLMIGLALLIKKTKKQSKVSNYFFVILLGFVVFIFKSSIKVMVGFYGSEGAIPTAVSLVSTIFGIYSIIWAIIKLIKFKRVKI